MAKTITVEELIRIVEKADLDKTVKEILIRDIKAEGVNEFYIDQVIAYCDNALAIINEKIGNQHPA